MLKPRSLPDNLRPILTKVGRQRGAATLVVAIILLLALTIVTFSAARIGVSEQRTSVNDMRNKEAMEVALAGLEHGLAYLEKNKSKINLTIATGWMAPGSTRWIACSASSIAPPCGDGVNNIYGPANPQVGGRNGNWLAYASVGDVNAVQFPPGNKYKYDVSYLTPGFDIDPGPGVTLGPDNNPIIIIVSTATPTPDATTGVKDPLAGSASARMTVRGYSTLMNIPAAPLMASGNVTPTGSVNIWGNPTGRLMAPLFPATQNPVSVITTVTGSTPPSSSSSTTTATVTNGGVPPTTVSNATLNIGPLGSSTLYDGWGGGPGDPDGPYTATTTVTTTDGNTTTAVTTWGTPLSAWAGGATPIPVASGTSTCRNLPPPFILPANPCRDFEYTFKQSASSPSFQPMDLLRQDFLNGNRISAYLPGVQCNEPFPGTALIPPNAPACPAIVATDLFSYVFGVPDTKFQIIKNEFTPITCSGLTPALPLPPGRYWLMGDCTLSGGVTIGTIDEPLILVVESGDLTISGGSVFFGLIYVRDSLNTKTITLNGNGTLYGALVSDQDIDDVTGDFNVVYDANVLSRAGGTSGGGFAKLTGGWRDQLQP